MPRPDGRIEKGQRLNTAISARAWNRAQDAADHVLGVRPGFEASAGAPGPSKVVFPVRINGGTPFTYAAIKINVTVGAYGINTAQQTSPYTSGVPHLENFGLPTFITGSLTDGTAGSWCICEPKLSATSDVSYCVMSGVTFARVRVRSSVGLSHGFAQPSQARDGGAYPAINGVLDSTECECDGAAKILAIGGNGFNQVYWAMILL